MALEVIGAGLGRNATFTMKFALEQLGFRPCYHMAEVFAGARINIPQWLEVIEGRQDWDAIFAGYRSTTDYPACTWWKELADYYPQAKVVLTTRDPDRWFDSITETIFSERMNSSIKGTPFEALLNGCALQHFGGRLSDRAFMTDWYVKRNQEVIDTLPPERLLVFHPREGWEPLCRFLGVAVPDLPFPKVNSRDELGNKSDEHGGLPADPEELEHFAKAYIEQLRSTAFPA